MSDGLMAFLDLVECVFYFFCTMYFREMLGQIVAMIKERKRQ